MERSTCHCSPQNVHLALHQSDRCTKWCSSGVGGKRTLRLSVCVKNSIEICESKSSPCLCLDLREQWNRSNIFYSDDLERLSYIPITTLFFDRNQSIGPDDELVTVLNVPLMAMAHSIIHDFSGIQSAINIFLDLLQTPLFVTVSVKDLMEGNEEFHHSVNLTSIHAIFLVLIGYTDPLIETASIVRPGVLRDNKFGILQAVKI